MKHYSADERPTVKGNGFDGIEIGELIFEFPKNLQHPIGRANLTAAYLLEYWAKKGAIPRYDGVIDGLRDGATEISKVAKPVRSNAELTGWPGAKLKRSEDL